MADGQYDIVHVHTPIASFLSRYALRHRQSPARVIYTAHGFHFSKEYGGFKAGAFRLAEEIAARWTDRLLVLNQDDLETAKGSLISPEKVTYTPGVGVDLNHYNRACVPDQKTLRDRLGISLESTVFLLIAELNPGKRHRDAIEGFARLNQPNSFLLFAGDGPLKGKLEELCRVQGVAGRVRFLGQRSDIRELIVSSDATILPSEREGLPRSIMESLALEVPVIATDIRGSRELVDPSCGFVVPLGNADAIHQAMLRVSTNKSILPSMGAAGRRKMAGFSLDRVVGLYEEIYEDELAENRRSSA